METFDSILKYIRWIPGLIFVITFLYGVFLTVQGVLPALWRLGRGLARRQVTIFANSDHANSLSELLGDSKIFQKKNVRSVSTPGDINSAEKSTLFLVQATDWSDEDIERILTNKKDGTALILYAPQSGGRVSDRIIGLLEEHRNVTLVNFRGRLLNDILISLMTTEYEKK